MPMQFFKNRFKKILLWLFSILPFSVQVLLVRGNPEGAFYVRKVPRKIRINYFLNKYSMDIDVPVDLQRRMLSGSYESSTMKVLRQLIQPGNTCIDIGANVGAITIAMADIVGERGAVLAFEPGPTFYERLKSNLELNPSLQSIVDIHPVGLSDRQTTLAWQASDVYTGTASMDPALHVKNLETKYLPVHRFDEYEPLQTLERIDFIKMDVDGLELPIFKGALASLKKHKPKLFFETTLWNEEQKKNALEIEQILLDLNYNLFKLDETSGEIAPVRFPHFSQNTIAIPN